MKFCTHILIHRFYVDIHGWIYLYPQVPLSPVYMYYDSCIILHGDKNLSPSPTFPVVPVPIHIPSPLFLSTFPSPWYNISLTQLTNHQLVLFSSRRMFTWHLSFYTTSNSASSQFTVLQSSPCLNTTPIVKYKINTAILAPVPTELLWIWSPTPECYCKVPITASNSGQCGFLWSPIPHAGSSLTWRHVLRLKCMASRINLYSKLVMWQ